jgi:hypothetical protein
MKKSLIAITASILLLCTLYTPAQAQVNKNIARVGIKGGVNFSSLYTEDSQDSKMLAGFNVGLFSKVPITQHVALQPELYFTTKGSEVTYNNTFVDGTARFKLSYIELPLLLAINVTDNFNIHAGPYAAYLVSGKATNESNVNLFDFEDNINADDYNRFDAGIAVGAGIDFGSLGIGVRYNYGLTTVGKERSFLGTTYTFPDAKNGVLNFYAAISLN